MNKKIKTIISLLLTMTMIAGMCSCGLKEKKSADLFTGELIDAQNDRLVVRGEDETMLFETTEKTVYDLKDETNLTVGDQINVVYHRSKDVIVADTVTLKEHKKESLVFGGEVTELSEKFMTVQSESMTAVFNYDSGTKIEGNLTKGDSVTVTYEGNISENPKAVSIVVIRENKEKEEKSLHGTVSEVADGSIIVSVDSAHGTRFQITGDTLITGDDTRLKVGDEVNMIYTGTAGENAVAKSIVIRRNTTQKYYVLDGVIDGVSSNKIVVRTASRTYTFRITSDTRIRNKEYMADGHMTTVTYASDADGNAVAISIHCASDTIKEVVKNDTTKNKEVKKTEKKTAAKKAEKKAETVKKTEQKKDTAKKAEKTKTEEKKADTAKKQDQAKAEEKKADTSAKKADTSKTEKKTDSSDKKEQAEVEKEKTSSADDKDLTKKEEITDDTTDQTVQESKDTTEEVTDDTQVTDTTGNTDNTDTNTSTDETVTDETNDDQTAGDQTVEDQNTETVEEQTGDQTVSEGTEEATGMKVEDPDEQMSEKNDDQGEPATVIIRVKGEILKLEGSKCQIKAEGGATLDLDAKDAMFAAGYIAQTGDQVIVSYNKDTLKITEIQLEYRPVAQAQAETAEDAEADEAAED